jgi:hypothetical protein
MLAALINEHVVSTFPLGFHAFVLFLFVLHITMPSFVGNPQQTLAAPEVPGKDASCRSLDRE